MKAFILANGDLTISHELLHLAENADYLIATDGGARHCLLLGRQPDVLVGDMDSISCELLQKYEASGVLLLKFPARKNATDLELAIDHAITKGATEIIFAGMLGGRWDMSLANILLLAHDKYKNVPCTLIGDTCVIHVLHPGKHRLTTKAHQRASLLPLTGEVRDVSLTGFEYPLDHFTIAHGSSRGLSNLTVCDTVTIEHATNLLLLIFSEN
jgi:thiamine pyrophosphokinase